MDSAISALRKKLPESIRWACPIVSRLTGIQAICKKMGSASQLQNQEFVEEFLKALKIRGVYSRLTLPQIPSKGPVIIVANHHYGAVDALLIFAQLLAIRPDLKVAINKSFVFLIKK
jgi:hypothetical protein